jgi:hypothetical protein
MLTAAVLCRSAAAVDVPSCSWPLETTGMGLTNVAYPDTSATYWTMPFDADRWTEIVITGMYPEARFFSFTTYDATGNAFDSIVDVDIQANVGSCNPFKPGEACMGSGQGPGFGRNYTITMSHDSKTSEGGNHLAEAPTRLGWVIYRVYVPDKGQDRQGGVPLPGVVLVSRDGSRRTLTPCDFSDFGTALTDTLKLLRDPSVNHAFDDAINFLATKVSEGDDGGLSTDQRCCASVGTCVGDRVLFTIPENTGGYFPNPTNKYIAGANLCFESERVIVVRGKAGAFPDTYNGAPVWQPADAFHHIQLRYWSLCNNDQVAPFPVVQCEPDWNTNLDTQWFYTYVISVDESGLNPPQPPPWVPPDATWLSWGSIAVPKVLILRNQLPEPSFRQSVQEAEAKGCVVNNGMMPTPEQIAEAAQCAQGVMGLYYPLAAYCDKQLFIDEGWQGCFAAAGIPVQ